MKNTLFDFISKYISLTQDEKNALLSLDLFRTVKKGTTLLKKGQKSRDSYFVLLGLDRIGSELVYLAGKSKSNGMLTVKSGDPFDHSVYHLGSGCK